MVTTTVMSIVTNSALVATTMDVVHFVWAHLPALTAGLRAVGAALSMVAAIRALRDHRPRSHD